MIDELRKRNGTPQKNFKRELEWYNLTKDRQFLYLDKYKRMATRLNK